MRLALNTIVAEPHRWVPDKSLARPIEETLEVVARAGYGAAEVWQHHLTNRDPRETAAFAERAKALGVRVVAVGGYPMPYASGDEREEEIKRVDRLMNDCEVFGASIFKLFIGRIGSDSLTPEQRELSIGFLKDLADRAADRGITLTAETHAKTLVDSVGACETLVSELGAPNFKLCYQPFNPLDTKAALADFDALRSHIVHLHLQAKDENGFCLMKDASLDHNAFLRHVKASGFDGLLCVEYVKGSAPRDLAEFSDDEVAEAAEEDREFVQSIWNE